jgi:hypothetical protein
MPFSSSRAFVVLAATFTLAGCSDPDPEAAPAAASGDLELCIDEGDVGGMLTMQLTGGFVENVAWGNEGTSCGAMPIGDASDPGFALSFERSDSTQSALRVTVFVPGADPSTFETGVGFTGSVWIQDIARDLVWKTEEGACSIDVTEIVDIYRGVIGRVSASGNCYGSAKEWITEEGLADVGIGPFELTSIVLL